MTDGKTLTKADIDAAVEAALAPVLAKRDELLSEVKELKGKLRATQEIKPEDFTALENERDQLATKLAQAEKAAKDAAKQAESATKALEAEQGAARTYALEAEINAAIAAGNIVPALVPAFTAMVKQQAKADLVDGKYAVQIGDKPARDYITSYLDTDEGKAFRAAPANGGGGATGGSGGGSSKAITREQFDAMPAKERATFMTSGGAIKDAA